MRKLPQAEQAAAEENFLVLKPRLQTAAKTRSQEETARHEKMRADLIHKTATLHEEIRVLTHHILLIQKALDAMDKKLEQSPRPPKQSDSSRLRMHPEYNTPRALTNSYRLLDKGLESAASTKERAPILRVIREDLEDLKGLNPTQDTALAANVPQFAPYQHALEQGTLRTSSPSRNEITFRSLMQKHRLWPRPS